MEPDLTDTIQTWRGMYGNHVHGPWIAEIHVGGMRHSERGHTEEEAREKLLDALRRLRG